LKLKVSPLSGNAPLTVKMTGARLTKENREAFYRWYNFQGTDTLVSSYYNDEFTYTNPGIYRIQVRGRDYVSRNTTKEFIISVNAPSGIDNTSDEPIHVFLNPFWYEISINGVPEGLFIILFE
jgi:PKD repeat protein